MKMKTPSYRRFESREEGNKIPYKKRIWYIAASAEEISLCKSGSTSLLPSSLRGGSAKKQPRYPHFAGETHPIQRCRVCCG